MTAPTVRVVRRPQPSQAMRRHPLATRDGIELLQAMLAAADHWRPLTAKQRDALRAAYRTALTQFPADLPDGVDHLDIETPRLGDVHPATLQSLVRRGLATKDGHVTDLALHVVQHADPEPVA